MNPYGSYRALLGNSVSAILAAIEVYNKPRIEYRSECCVILLLNAWELLFKAICSKNRVRIFEPKERGKPYRTLKLWAAFEAARPYLPAHIPWKAVGENIGRLADYRNNVVHFYNDESLGVVVYGLAQTSIVNYRDILQEVFERNIAAEVNIALLPLAFSAPPDPIAFLGGGTQRSKPTAEFLGLISETTRDLEKDGIDTARFFTVFEVNLQSTKKIESADIVAGVQDSGGPGGTLLISRKVDPNKSHPHPRKEILEKVGAHVDGEPFTSYAFQAIVWQYDIKEKEHLCWHNRYMNTYQYSPELAAWMRRLTAEEIREARENYGADLRKRRQDAS